MIQPDPSSVEGLQLALVRLRHGLGNALVLTDVAHQKTSHLDALWRSLQETQQLITDVLPHLDQEER
jgi:hypothetical protein